MRVLHVGKFYPPAIGGMERIVRLMAHALSSREGMEVDVLVSSSSGRGGTEKDGAVTVTRLATYGSVRSIPITPSMVTSGRLFRKYDVVHVHSPNPLAELAWLTSTPPTALVASDWGQITRQKALLKFYGPLYRKYFQVSDAVAVPSRRYAEGFAHLRECTDKLVDVPLGIDAGAWSATPEVEEKAGRLRGGGLTVLFVGRLVPFKGVHILIEAMKSVDARLLIVGDGPERQRLEGLAKRLELADRVRFLGALQGADLTAAYRAADLFVLPSVSPNEAFPQSLLEAITCGLPAVSTELGTGTSEINLDKETGLVVPPSDIQGLTGAMQAILKDQNLRAKFARAASERARARYSIAAMTDALVACYEKARARWQMGA